MKSEELKEIFENTEADWQGDNALQGLIIIGKYFERNKSLLCGADHDVIYSVDVDKLCENGLTLEDAELLAKLNWFIQDEYLQCYV